MADAAVMGYVRGSMHPRGEEIPLNADILADVINACFAFPHLYPTITGYQPELDDETVAPEGDDHA